jgi:tetratricopeptide (TPR) repeat protein
MDEASVKKLLGDLQNPDAEVRDRATQALWESWFWQKGLVGMEQLKRSQELLKAGEPNAAERLLSQVILEQPDFAEAWNRRAVLYYTQQEYEKAIADCERTLEIIPYHFGALHGLGLSYAALGEYRLAIQAFNRALEVQPHALINKQLLLECMALL